MLARGLLADGVAHIRHLCVFATVIIAAQFKDQGLHMTPDLLLGNSGDNLRHPGRRKGKRQLSSRCRFNWSKSVPLFILLKQYIRLIMALLQLGWLHKKWVKHRDSLGQHCYLQLVLFLHVGRKEKKKVLYRKGFHVHLQASSETINILWQMVTRTLSMLTLK